MASKKVSHSQVVMSSLMLPQHANTSGNVHGGEIMKLMDSAAAVVARRHARSNVVTARVDELRFLHPCHIGDVVTCYGKLTFVGRTSMEVLVTVTVEDVKRRTAKMALTAYFTFVALDEQGNLKRYLLWISKRKKNCVCSRKEKDAIWLIKTTTKDVL